MDDMSTVHNKDGTPASDPYEVGGQVLLDDDNWYTIKSVRYVDYPRQMVAHDGYRPGWLMSGSCDERFLQGGIWHWNIRAYKAPRQVSQTVAHPPADTVPESEKKA